MLYKVFLKFTLLNLIECPTVLIPKFHIIANIVYNLNNYTLHYKYTITIMLFYV